MLDGWSEADFLCERSKMCRFHIVELDEVDVLWVRDLVNVWIETQ